MDKELETISEILDRVYKDGYAMGKEEAYNKGLEDAWKCARKICKMESDDRMAIFSTKTVSGTIDYYEATDAIANLKAYEEKQKQDDEIKVGDVVKTSMTTGYVTRVAKHKDICYILWLDGSCGTLDMNFVKGHKTGRHFDGIVEMLEQIKGGTQHEPI